MIRQALRIDPRRTGLLDVCLIGLAAVLAAFSLCESVGSQSDAIFFTAIMFLGMWFSFFFCRYAAKTKLVKADGILYPVALALALTFHNSLNTLLPDNTLFSDNALSVAGGICWMLTIGSFLTWRDSMLLFQAVPSLAIFGLVGCFDTFKEATALFFVFMLCLATLMARAHGRLMMKQAADSGHTRIGSLSDGPWRWMAGPEWALASATAVVCLSILGAPVIQEEAHNLGISGLLHIQPPNNRKLVPSLFNQSFQGSVSIGQGPNHLSSEPVLRAQIDHPDYLRSTSYYEYSGTGWRTYRRAESARRKPLWDYSQQLMASPQSVSYGIEVLKPMQFLPTPESALEIKDQPNLDRSWDGSFQVRQTFVNLPKIVGVSWEVPPTVQAGNAPSPIDPDFEVLEDQSLIPPSVKKLAEQVTRGAHSDYEKAQMITTAVSQRCKYNINAAATPQGQDPVEYFLFTSHEGYCDLFASSVVAMARSVGLPARYSVGYLPDAGSTDGFYIAKESDAHAWGEVLFDKAGWRVFDATLGSENVAGGQRGASTEAKWYETFWFRFIGLPLLIVGFGYAAVRAFKLAKMPKVVVPRKELGKIYGRFERVLLPLAGHPRRLSQTTSEYVDASKNKLGDLYPVAAQLNSDFELALYGFEEPDETDIEQLKKNVEKFRSEAKNNKDLVGSGKGKR